MDRRGDHWRTGSKWRMSGHHLWTCTVLLESWRHSRMEAWWRGAAHASMHLRIHPIPDPSVGGGNPLGCICLMTRLSVSSPSRPEGFGWARLRWCCWRVVGLVCMSPRSLDTRGGVPRCGCHGAGGWCWCWRGSWCCAVKLCSKRLKAWDRRRKKPEGASLWVPTGEWPAQA